MRINEGSHHPVSRSGRYTAAQPGTMQAQPPLPPAFPETYDQLDFVATGTDGDAPGSCRWPETAFPLRVWLVPNPEIPDFEADTFALLAQWEYAGGEPICFTKATSADEADVVVDWIEEATLGRDFEMGHTDRTVDPVTTPDGKTSGNIRFVKVNLHQKPLINAYLGTKNALRTAFFATILHEFGHVLGLEHSQNPADVMFYRGFQNAKPTESDTRRLRFLYR